VWRRADAGESGAGPQVDDLKITVRVPKWKPAFMPPWLGPGTVPSETIDAARDLHTHLTVLDDAHQGERGRFRQDVRPLSESIVPPQRLGQLWGKSQAKLGFGGGDGFLGCRPG
jgi:hypothetical protein